MDKSLLIIDDERPILDALTRALSGIDVRIRALQDPRLALETMKKEVPQVVVTDLKMPGMDGLAVLDHVKSINPAIQVVLITGHGTVDDAVTAMKKGAYDFIPKPFKRQEILAVINRAFEKADLLHENFRLKERLKRTQNPNYEWGKSPLFKELLTRAAQAANSDATILILGESGTGKEVLANYIYENSQRVGRPFVKVNCAAIPENLLESELFGYKRGSFTGAQQDKTGKFTEAHRGTIFLDEIGEIPLSLQPKLLRILQEGEIHPIGGQAQQVDVRIIAATNKNMREQVREGKFREDLFYRLNVIPLTIPPLRHRSEDVPTLVSHFIQKYCQKNRRSNLTVSPGALKLMENYSWPGNVRELENAIERAVILCPSHQISEDDLPAELNHEMERVFQLNFSRFMTLEEIELQVILQTLKRNHGDKVRTAEELGISLRTIYRKLEVLAHLNYDLSELQNNDRKEEMI